MYNRMNPDIKELVQRLTEYADVDYGTEAYPLSTAEAKALINERWLNASKEVTEKHSNTLWKLRVSEMEDSMHELCDAVYKWAGRPTKDGAKNLRQIAASKDSRLKDETTR